MLIPRVIPCLLMERGVMVKTRNFRKRTYLGDPVNVVNIFNMFEVDEIVLLDINATIQNKSPDFELIEQIAEECWVPLTYGGGIKNIHDVEKLIYSGVEKVIIGYAAFNNMGFISSLAREFGSQCIVGSVDSKKTLFGDYTTYVYNGKINIKETPVVRTKQFENAGAGEILLQSINRDGTMKGYDLNVIEQVTMSTSLPVVACGGAGTHDDLRLSIIKSGASAAAAGSLFVYSGIERGVLINFPERSKLEALLRPSPV